ncbi:MAG: Asp-tRNA(Asn)/Glu-tRNA(Gln) amidotransferase subunit GatB [Deltaproteobacteria bacterium]|nr:Asp-tRNA(Asn)/Glu-tRNA(Gln) amidotransferase subunit GatB [Deltaproteobacteria bacterium]
MTWEAVIGLEVHAQLRTRSKMFCGCATRFGDRPNANVCAVCTGQPGALPVVNRRAVELGCAAALALGCEVRSASRFARKSYFYPDLPKGFQISQYERPLAEHGRLEFVSGTGERQVGIVRVHLEEDAGRSVHDAAAGRTLVDLSRCGVPLAEIVTAPDLRTPEEASDCLRALRLLLVRIGACDGSLERGSLRCDVNVSVRRAGETALGIRVEVKNLNSYRHVRDALAHEIARQSEALERGEAVRPQTRSWNDAAGRTEVLRDKEEAPDYRYFPEPDLPPLVLEEGFVERVRAELPELPLARRRRFERELGLPPHDAAVLAARGAAADLFEATASLLAASGVESPQRRASGFVLNEVLRDLPDEGAEDGDDARSLVDAGRLAELLRLVADGTISSLAAKEVYRELPASAERPAAIVDRRGLAQRSDAGAIEEAARCVLAEHPDAAARFRGGNARVLGFLVAEVVRRMEGRGNPRMAAETLRRLLEGEGEEGSHG